MISYVPVDNRKQLSGQLFWFLLWVGVTAFAIYLTPSAQGHGTHTELGLPPCPCVLFFGRPCPGCGLTTSFTAFIHGQWGFAFHAHPFGPLLYLGLAASGLACGYGYWKKLKLDLSGRTFNRFTTAFICVFMVFGVIRFAMNSHYADTDAYHQALVKAVRK